MAATRKAMVDCADEIETDYRGRIEFTAREVESVLATENSSGSGDLKKLQPAIAALDEATKPLADFLMDKAMAAMLRKRGLIQ